LAQANFPPQPCPHTALNWAGAGGIPCPTMVLNRTNCLSSAEIAVWRSDSEDLPPASDCAESHAHERSTEEGHSDDTESAIGFRQWSYSTASSPKAETHRGIMAPAVPHLLEAGDGQGADEHDVATISLLRARGPGLKALFLDYDGTLRELTSTPELAVPTQEVHDLLAALSRREDLLVHIVSGRDAQFLSGHFAQYKRVVLIAEHERRVAGRFQVWRPTPDSPSSPSTSTTDWHSAIRSELSRACNDCPGSQIEEKALSVVWHFRAVRDEAAAEAAASALTARLEELVASEGCCRGTKVSRHSKTVEASRRCGTKGDIVRRICDSRAATGTPFEAVLAAGDDISDEAMFNAGFSAPCLSVKVGRGETTAKCFVDTPAELRDFLWRLAEEAPPA